MLLHIVSGGATGCAGSASSLTLNEGHRLLKATLEGAGSGSSAAMSLEDVACIRESQPFWEQEVGLLLNIFSAGAAWSTDSMASLKQSGRATEVSAAWIVLSEPFGLSEALDGVRSEGEQGGSPVSLHRMAVSRIALTRVGVTAAPSLLNELSGTGLVCIDLMGAATGKAA